MIALCRIFCGLREPGNLLSACCILIKLTCELTILSHQRLGKVFNHDVVVIYCILADPVGNGNNMIICLLCGIERRRNLECHLLDGIDTIYSMVICSICRSHLAIFHVIVAIKHQIIVFISVIIRRCQKTTISIHGSGTHKDIAVVRGIVKQRHSTPVTIIAVKKTFFCNISGVYWVGTAINPSLIIHYMIITC